ncbi:hypothetical protein AAK882_05185 [Carnobacteriaceae bacterium 52-44]
MKILKNKELLKNVGINIFSVGLYNAVIQLLVFPFLSKEIGAINFGITVSLYGFNQLIYTFLGNTINNIRLIYDDEVKNKGNFTILILIGIVLTGIASTLLYSIYGQSLRWVSILVLVLWTMMSSLRAYLLVYFRLEINYLRIFLNNIFLLIGYLVGVFFFNFISFWGIIFITGEIFALIYLFKTTPFLSEKPEKTDEIRPLVKETSNLTLSNFVSNSMTYLDRFLITPMLGATSMSLYYSVSVFTKFINMAVTPFNNVMLSYMNNLKKENARKYFIAYNGVMALLLVPIYFLMILITPYLLDIFYPEYAEAATNLIPFVSLANVFKLLTGMINPFILKFKPMKYQSIIQFTFGIVYLVLAVSFVALNGLSGFAIATALAYIFKWVLMFFLGIKEPQK